MKKCTKSLVVVWLTMLALFQSCSESHVVPTGQKKYGGTVSFTANGQVYNLSANNISVAKGDLQLSSLFSKSDQNNTFAVNIRTGIAATTYDLTNNKLDVWVNYYDGTADGYYLSNAGQVVITTIDEQNKTMSGTFSAKVDLIPPSTAVNIANGVFTDVPYELQPESSGTLTVAKVDGSEFKGKLQGIVTSPTFKQFDYVNANQTLTFSLPNNLVEGNTYNAIDLAAPTYFIKYVDGLYSYAPTAGTFTITKYTPGTEIQGTYEVQMESYPVGGKAKSITNGTFNVKFP